MSIDPEELSWFAAQRKLVEEYLQRQKLTHRGVARFPTFHVYPHLAVWAVQSQSQPGSAGWWAISGDLPMDFIQRPAIAHARDALRQFSDRWREVADYMKRGEPHPHITMGPPEKWDDLAPLLRSRAEALLYLVNDDALWKRDANPKSPPHPGYE